MRKIVARMALGVFLSFSIAGCSSFRIHSEVRDKQGQTAQEALKKVDLSGIFTTASDNLKKQLQTELESQDKMGAAIRAQELEAIVLSDNLNESLVTPLDNKLMKLTGAKTWRDAQQRMEDSRKSAESDAAIKLNQESMAKIFQRNLLPVPSCDDLTQGKIPTQIQQAMLKWNEARDTKRLASIGAALDQSKKLCGQSQVSKWPWTAFADSDFEIALLQAKHDKAEYDNLKKTSQELRDAYKTARAAYDAAVKEAKSDSSRVSLVAEKAAELDNAIDKLDKAKDALSLQFISSERIDAVREIVDVVLQGAKDGKVPDNAGHAQAAFILIPQQMDEFKSALAAAKTPLIAPLAVRKNFEQIKLDAATRELALLQRRVELSEQIVEAQYSEMQMLDRASRQLHEEPSKGKPSLDTLYGGRPVIEAFSKASGADATRLYDAAATYLDDLARLEPAIYKLKYQRLATYHQVSLIYAETNTRHWMNLISASTNQVAESASGGIKPETITQAIQAATLFWIGNGVN